MPDPDADLDDLQPRKEGEPRIAFQIMPASAVLQAPAPRWQAFAAGGLFLFTAATCLQLGLVANVSRLPKARAHAPPQISPVPQAPADLAGGWFSTARVAQHACMAHQSMGHRSRWRGTHAS